MPSYVFNERDFGRVSKVVQQVERQTERGRPPSDPGGSIIHRPVSITFRNDSSETVPAFGIMAVTDADFTQSHGPYLICGKPASDSTQYVVNDCVPVEGHKWGQCFVSGWVRVAYSGTQPGNGDKLGPSSGAWTVSIDTSPAIIQCCGFVSDSSTLIGLLSLRQQARLCLCQLTAAQTGSDASFTVDTLTSVDGGILPTGTITGHNTAKQSGPDNAIACIQWNENTDQWEIQWIEGNGSVIIGKLDGSLSQGSTATVSVWAGGSDTGVNITASDWLMKSGATAIASGKKVVCQFINGTWYVVEAECP